MKSRLFSLVAAVMTCGTVGFGGVPQAAEPSRPAISQEVATALQQMGKTLSAKSFSFKANTIRVYQDNDGDFLHIAHNMNVTVRRPNDLAVKVNGDDGSTQLLYDGKTAAVFNAPSNKYATIPA